MLVAAEAFNRLLTTFLGRPAVFKIDPAFASSRLGIKFDLLSHRNFLEKGKVEERIAFVCKMKCTEIRVVLLEETDAQISEGMWFMTSKNPPKPPKQALLVFYFKNNINSSVL